MLETRLLISMIALVFMLALCYDSYLRSHPHIYRAAMIYPHPPLPINLLFVYLVGLASRSCMLMFVCSRVWLPWA